MKNPVSFKKIVALFLIGSLFSCKAQNKQEKIFHASKKIMTSIVEEDANEFISNIAFNDLGDISKNREIVNGDIKRYNSLFKTYSITSVSKIRITNLYNSLGQLLVIIPIFENKQDSLVHEMHLELLFGPENLFPLNKITGYDLVENNANSSDFKPYSYWKERGRAK